MLINQPRAARFMDELGLEALLAATQPNVFYLTGIWRAGELFALAKREALTQPGMALPRSEVDYLLEAFREPEPMVTYGTFFRAEGQGQLTADEDQVLRWHNARQPEPNACDALCALIVELGLESARIGFDEKGLEPAYLPEIETRFPKLQLVPSFQTFRKIRAIKTPAELERLEGAMRVTEQAIAQAASIARPGLTEAEMQAEFEATQIRLGASQRLCHIGFGHGGMLGMINRPNDKLQPCDLIRFDCGCIHRGYSSDLARTFVLGEPSAKQRQAYGAIFAGEQAGIDNMKPGMACSDVFALIMKAVRDNGLPEYQRQHTGHGLGIGLAGYDMPLLGPNDHTPLEPGMFFEVETPYYEFGFGGMQVEDSVIVTETGARMLTTLSRELGVLPV
ncbi:MAG: M24 family metallopeptidase [Chloroflexota bacterium]